MWMNLSEAIAIVMWMQSNDLVEHKHSVTLQQAWNLINKRAKRAIGTFEGNVTVETKQLE
jgi:hypothetical protein